MTSIISSDESIRKIISSSVVKATSIAAIPIPFIDTAGVMFVQYQLIESLAQAHGKSIDNKQVALITTGLSAIMTKLITESFHGISKKTNMNKIFGKAMVSAAVVSLFTTAIGDSFNLHFKNGGRVDNFGLDAVVNYAQFQIASDKLSIEHLSNSLIQNVIKNV